MTDVILGATLVDARYWKGHFSRTIPELIHAVEVSATTPESIYGLRVNHIYIAPGAQDGKHFDVAVETLKIRQLLSHVDEDPIVLSSKGAL